ANWTTNEWAGQTLALDPLSQTTYLIASNTATTLTLAASVPNGFSGTFYIVPTGSGANTAVVAALSQDGGQTFTWLHTWAPYTSVEIPSIAAAPGAADAGTASSSTNTTLTDSSKSWAGHQWQNQQVYIASGTGPGQLRTISDNTATVLTVSTAWTTNPDATSKYVILNGTSSVWVAWDGSTSGSQGSPTMTGAHVTGLGQVGSFT